MKNFSETDALLVIDVQRDFCPGGALEVKGGDRVVPVINRIMPLFSRVVATQDWHPVDHVSFAVNHEGKKVLDTLEINGITQMLWPEHCVQGSEGAGFHSELNTKLFHLILRKGIFHLLDSYSSFFENDRKTATGLHFYLKGLGVESVYLCGLATDYCVFYSAMDAVKLGFRTCLIEDACRGVDFPPGSVDRALREMKSAEVKILKSKDLLG
ncbi:MAG: hypothetical protein AMS17_13585 [Spirochaetes bacterium DG_61]|nr:MAG: hypothetical protein AMS17_13585 [Spirochaetes bacterium DG_61]